MEKTIIKSCETGASLIFFDKVGEKLNVKYESSAINVMKTVWLYEDFPFLVGFFQKIDTKWKGWDNEIEFKSIESDFSISAKSDSLGHAFLTICFNEYHDSEEWSANVNLKITTSQAENIVKSLKTL